MLTLNSTQRVDKILFYTHKILFNTHKKQLKCVRFCCLYYYSFMVLWSLSRNRTLRAVVAKPYGKCLVSHSHQTVNQWKKTLRLLTSLNCLTPSGPHYYPVDGVCGFNVISKLFYCAYHKSVPEPLETELVKLCHTLATANPHF